MRVSFGSLKRSGMPLRLTVIFPAAGLLLEIRANSKDPTPRGCHRNCRAGARGEHLGAGLAEMRERVVAPEGVDHFHGVGFTGVGLVDAARKRSTEGWIWITSTY